jgi:ectoine hydroxylase-related dioxygenase (phytanoyl-CoA dioxygenase family)
VTIRIGIDACREDNGPLRVIPGSHTDKIPEAELPSGPFVECLHEAGGAVLMRPLAVHASLRAAKPGRRRVIHLEYASVDLPPPLRWAFA